MHYFWIELGRVPQFIIFKSPFSWLAVCSNQNALNIRLVYIKRKTPINLAGHLWMNDWWVWFKKLTCSYKITFFVIFWYWLKFSLLNFYIVTVKIIFHISNFLYRYKYTLTCILQVHRKSRGFDDSPACTPLQSQKNKTRLESYHDTMFFLWSRRVYGVRVSATSYQGQKCL